MATTKLTLADVARIFGEERARRDRKPIEGARPYTEQTVRSMYLTYRGKGDLPFPEPDAGGTDEPSWSPKKGETREDVIERLRTWFRTGRTVRLEKSYLTLADLGRIFGEELALREGRTLAEAQPYTPGTVKTMYNRYRKGGNRTHAMRDPNSDPNAAHYEANPFPEDDGAAVYLWSAPIGGTLADTEDDLRWWFRTGRPGRGARSGSTKKAAAQEVTANA